MLRLHPSAGGSARLLALVAAGVLAAALGACVNPNAIGVQDTGIVIGRVLDAKTQQPIGNALVSVNSLVGGHTDPSGAFSIKDVPIGIQHVTVIANGYASYTSGDISVTKGDTSQAGLIQLQPVNPT
jgi:hypothetical protein